MFNNLGLINLIESNIIIMKIPLFVNYLFNHHCKSMTTIENLLATREVIRT